jgi:arsenate reductase
MAEGFLRAFGGNDFEAFSAGAKPAGYVHPLAVRAMREVTVDISRHQSKSLESFAGQQFDYLITVCDNAREACPTLPGAAKQRHWSFDDPAHATGSDEQKMAEFRRVRDEIELRVRAFVNELRNQSR